MCLFINCMELIVIYFFLADSLLGGVIFNLDKHVFPCQRSFIWGGDPKLKSSCTLVDAV
jgi:hypothetical protein